MKFLLGCPEPSWAYRQDAFAREQVPLFISYSRLLRRKSPYPPARVPIWFDSSGFMMLKNNGRWTIDALRYCIDVNRYHDELGPPGWAAPQDWMCEPWIVAKTGLTVREHQRRTIANFLELCRLWREHSDAECPFIPALQGWETKEYRDCLRMYADAGVDLYAYKVVGLGSTCRRQNTDEVEEIVDAILGDAPGLRLHGFGIKAEGIDRVGALLASSDSQAWSDGARHRNIRLPGCVHKNCNYCPRYALTQYHLLVARAAVAKPKPHQISIMRELELAS